jgi:long-chain acyl-CoA synthetase
MGIVDTVKYCLLKLLVVFIYITSHVYDYISYPVYFVIYHPWLVRRYGRGIHARREERDDCVIFHSLQEPHEVTIELAANHLDTLPKVFNYVAAKYSTKDCLGTREILAEEDEVQANGKVFKKLRMGEYKWISFTDFGEQSAQVACGLRELGVRGKDKVAILAESRAEWMIFANAAFQNNLTIVTLYTNLGNDGVIHGINETKVRYLICSHDTLAKVKSVAGKIEGVTTIIVMESLRPGKSIDFTGLTSFNVVPFQDLRALGRSNAAAASAAAASPTPDDTAIIMYTSGSTGNPKGVVLTHRNLIAGLHSLCTFTAELNIRERDRYIAFLPLAHVLELLAETTFLLIGVKLGYSSPQTLTNKSTAVKAGTKGDASVLRPTLICSVPLVLERIYKSIQVHFGSWRAGMLEKRRTSSW